VDTENSAESNYEQRRELIAIYNNLSPMLKKQLLTLARVIDNTREIVLKESKWKRKKAQTDSIT